MCEVFAVAKAPLDGFYGAYELLDDAFTGARVDNVAACLEWHHDYMKDQMQGVQNALDFQVEWRRLHLQVLELQEKREFLIGVTEAGRPPAEVMSHTILVSEKDPVSFVNLDDYATWTETSPGVWLVEINLPPDLSNVEIFKFEVWHFETFTDGDGNLQEVQHSGFTLFDRSAQTTICTGQ